MKKLLFLSVFFAGQTYAQNVGIGTSHPSAKLEVNATSTNGKPLVFLVDSTSGTNNHLWFGKQGINSNWEVAVFPTPIDFTSSFQIKNSFGKVPLTLTGDGRMGVNVASPLVTLDVNSPQNSNTANFNGANQMWVTLSEQGVERGYIGSYSGNAEDVDFGTYGSNATGKVHLTAGGNIPRLTVAPDGKVGIGTVAPAAKLDVDGDVNIRSKLLLNSSAGSSGQVLVSGGNGGVPAWRSAAFGNNDRFLYQTFPSSSTSFFDGNIVYTTVNSTSASITNNNGLFTVNKGGLYAFDLSLTPAAYTAVGSTDNPVSTIELRITYPGSNQKSLTIDFRGLPFVWTPNSRLHTTTITYNQAIYLPAGTKFNFYASIRAGSGLLAGIGENSPLSIYLIAE